MKGSSFEEQRVSQICAYSDGIPARLDSFVGRHDASNEFSDPTFPHEKIVQ